MHCCPDATTCTQANGAGMHSLQCPSSARELVPTIYISKHVPSPLPPNGSWPLVKKYDEVPGRHWSPRNLETGLHYSSIPRLELKIRRVSSEARLLSVVTNI